MPKRLTDFWKQLPNGEEIPEYFRLPLEWKNRKSWPNGLVDLIQQRHGELTWGHNWDCVDLPDTNHSVVVVRRIPDHSTDATFVPGLVEGKGHYSWQEGMVKVDGLYFFDKTSGTLSPVEEIVQRVADKPVRIYIYGEARKGKSEKVMFLQDKGKPYYAVFIHPITKVEDILSLFHELGHVVVEEENGTEYAQERERVRLFYDRDAQVANDSVAAFGENIPEHALSAARTAFHQSEGFQKAADLSMRTEVDAWSAGLMLIDEMGLTEAFEKGDKRLSDFMLYCIKTRIPSEP